MSKRAYSPRMATAYLASCIRALPGIARVDIIAPVRTAYDQKPTRLKVTTDGRSGDGSPIYTVFTLPEAREWYASEVDKIVTPL